MRKKEIYPRLREVTADELAAEKLTLRDTDVLLSMNLNRSVRSVKHVSVQIGRQTEWIHWKLSTGDAHGADAPLRDAVDVPSDAHPVVREEPRSIPPSQAEFVGALFIKSELREHVLGCRAEDFGRNVVRFGRNRAVFMYWWDIATSLRAPLWSMVKRFAGFSALADLYRRVTGGF